MAPQEIAPYPQAAACRARLSNIWAGSYGISDFPELAGCARELSPGEQQLAAVMRLYEEGQRLRNQARAFALGLSANTSASALDALEMFQTFAQQAQENVERREREWLAFKELIPDGPTLLLRSERQPRRPTITVNIHIHQPPSHD